MKHRQLSFTTLGIAGSIIFFFVFTIFIIFTSIHVLIPGTDRYFPVSFRNIFWLILPMIFVISVGLLYIWKVLFSNPQFFLSLQKKTPFSLGVSLGFVLSTVLFVYMSGRSELPPTIRLYICSALFFTGSFCYIHTFHYFVYLFLIKLFRNTLTLSEIIAHRNASIDNMEYFLSSHISIINRCKRSGDTLMIAGFIVNNRNAIEKEYGSNGSSQILRELDFTLAEHSRNYEPWGILPAPMIFYNFFQIRNQKEYTAIVKRYNSVLEKNEYVISDSVVNIDLAFKSILIPHKDQPASIFEDEEKQYLRSKITELTEYLISGATISPENGGFSNNA